MSSVSSRLETEVRTGNNIGFTFPKLFSLCPQIVSTLARGKLEPSVGCQSGSPWQGTKMERKKRDDYERDNVESNHSEPSARHLPQMRAKHYPSQSIILYRTRHGRRTPCLPLLQQDPLSRSAGHGLLNIPNSNSTTPNRCRHR